MSNNRDNFWDDEDDDDLEEYTPQFTSDTDLVKKLRKALRAEQKRNKELESSYADLSKSQKERILRDVLASRGVNPAIAEFIPADIEASEDAIGAWIDSKAELFNSTVKSNDSKAVSDSDVSALKRMDSVITGSDVPTGSDDLQSRIANATSEAEILSILSGN